MIDDVLRGAIQVRRLVKGDNAMIARFAARRARECKINAHGAPGGIFEVAVAHGKVRFVNNGAHPPVGAGGGVRYTEVRLQGLDDGLVDVTAVGKEKKVEVLVSLL